MDQCYKDIIEKQFSEARFRVEYLWEDTLNVCYRLHDLDSEGVFYFQVRADNDLWMEIWVNGRKERHHEDWAWLAQDINDLMVNMQ